LWVPIILPPAFDGQPQAPGRALSATPKKRTGRLSRAAKVLSGMQGTIWIERNSFHLIKVDAAVVTPVPIYLALRISV